MNQLVETPRSLSHTFKTYIKNPGSFYFKSEKKRNRYKKVTDLLFKVRKSRRFHLAKSLPEISDTLKIEDKNGFLLSTAAQTAAQYPETGAIIETCKKWLSEGRKSVANSKPYLRQVVMPEELIQVDAVLKFALDPKILSSVTQYLGELPVLTSIKFLHSTKAEGAWNASQFYHCDHDDIRQVKVFLNVSDVDLESGPLTVLPAFATEEVCKRVGYLYGGEEGHVPDDHLPHDYIAQHEKKVTGPQGTMALVDTSRVFHYGSRVSSKDRYIFYLQYVTLNNFIFNPFSAYLQGSKRLTSFPYSQAIKPWMSPVQKSVLTG